MIQVNHFHIVYQQLAIYIVELMLILMEMKFDLCNFVHHYKEGHTSSLDLYYYDIVQKDVDHHMLSFVLQYYYLEYNYLVSIDLNKYLDYNLDN